MSGDWKIKSIFHFTVNASNFERSLEFYTSIGFKVIRDNRDVIWPDWVAPQMGLKKAQARGALLAIGPEEHHTRLDLLEWLEPELDRPPDKPIDERVPRIIALLTENVEGLYEDLKAKGIEFVSQPRGEEALGLKAVCQCRDPDGLLVEFIEYMPGVLGSRVDSLPQREESRQSSG
jgi:glyoxylase I family protein